ncbi:hypothetical protein DIPPA_70183 [Diplonema papillatum]|nr:hypothetical protein DIPPA_70183 [Diplonema papillatum]
MMRRRLERARQLMEHAPLDPLDHSKVAIDSNRKLQHEWTTDSACARKITQLYREPHSKRKRIGDTELHLLSAKLHHEISQLRAKNCDVGYKTHNAVLSVFARISAAAECRKWFDTMPEKDLQSYNVMLHAYAKCGFVAHFDRLFSEMEKKQIHGSLEQPSPHTFAAVLLLLGRMSKDQRDERKTKLTKLIDKKGILNTVLANMIIGLADTAEEARMSFDRFFRHPENKIEFKEALISGEPVSLTKHDGADLKVPSTIVSQWTVQCDLQPDHTTILVLMPKCEGDTKLAEYFWKACINPHGHIVPGVREWTALLTVYKTAGSVKGMQKVWSRMLTAGTSPNQQTYGCFIKGCVRPHAIDEAAAKYNEALTMQHASSIHIHTNMMEVYASVQDKDAAAQVMRNVEHLNLPIVDRGPLMMMYQNCCSVQTS